MCSILGEFVLRQLHRYQNYTMFTFQGDEGGPLVCTRDGTSYLVGVLHHVDDLCFPTVPSVFTRISLYNAWIRSIIDA